MPPPTEDTVKILAQLNNLKTQLVGAMKAFNKILSDQTLSVNKSKQDKDVEQKIINDLVLAARGVDEISPGEGTLGVCVFAVRQALSLRDAGNKLAYELYQIKNRLDQIETDIYEEESGEK